ncbi:MAG: hypothetical protein ACRDQA_00825 [Nocardioidaceae bacterium]
MKIQLLHVADCPSTPGVLDTLRGCLQDMGVSATIEESEGAYPSPTLLIDGIDVVTGQPPQQGACCRLDLPSPAHIHSAVRASAP